MGFKDIIASKERQYGKGVTNLIEPSKKTAPVDMFWDSAKNHVDSMSTNFEGTLSSWIELWIKKGVFTVEAYEEREHSQKKISTITDLKYWGVLKEDSRRMSLDAPFRVFEKYPLELVIYSKKNGDTLMAWLAVFNTAGNSMYRRAVFEDI